jgi:hypothetical protein
MRSTAADLIPQPLLSLLSKTGAAAASSARLPPLCNAWLQLISMLDGRHGAAMGVMRACQQIVWQARPGLDRGLSGLTVVNVLLVSQRDY